MKTLGVGVGVRAPVLLLLPSQKRKWQIALLIISNDLRQKADTQACKNNCTDILGGSSESISFLELTHWPKTVFFSPHARMTVQTQAGDPRRVYLTTAWYTYWYRPQMGDQRALDSNHPHSRSARSPHGRWSCALDSESTEDPVRTTCRNHDHMLWREEEWDSGDGGLPVSLIILDLYHKHGWRLRHSSWKRKLITQKWFSQTIA